MPGLSKSREGPTELESKLLKGGSIGDYNIGDIVRLIKEDCRCLEYGLYGMPPDNLDA